jgi:hypothetical protein
MLENVFHDPRLPVPPAEAGKPAPQPWPLFPAAPAQSTAWLPAKPLLLPPKTQPAQGQTPDDGQWGAVSAAWVAADAAATETVKLWSNVMKWKTLEAKHPEYLAKNVANLYLNAPHFCVAAAA